MSRAHSNQEYSNKLNLLLGIRKLNIYKTNIASSFSTFSESLAAIEVLSHLRASMVILRKNISESGSRSQLSPSI